MFSFALKLLSNPTWLALRFFAGAAKLLKSYIPYRPYVNNYEIPFDLMQIIYNLFQNTRYKFWIGFKRNGPLVFLKFAEGIIDWQV